MFKKNDPGFSVGNKNRRVVEMRRTQVVKRLLMLCLLETKKTRLFQLTKLRMAKKNGGEKKDPNQETNHPSINSIHSSIGEGEISLNQD
jgi:hypothetical protein